LPHHPHGSAIDVLPQQRAQEQVILQHSSHRSSE